MTKPWHFNRNMQTCFSHSLNWQSWLCSSCNFSSIYKDSRHVWLRLVHQIKVLQESCIHKKNVWHRCLDLRINSGFHINQSHASSHYSKNKIPDVSSQIQLLPVRQSLGFWSPKRHIYKHRALERHLSGLCLPGSPCFRMKVSLKLSNCWPPAIHHQPALRPSRLIRPSNQALQTTSATIRKHSFLLLVFISFSRLCSLWHQTRLVNTWDAGLSQTDDDHGGRIMEISLGLVKNAVWDTEVCLWPKISLDSTLMWRMIQPMFVDQPIGIQQLVWCWSEEQLKGFSGYFLIMFCQMW